MKEAPKFSPMELLLHRLYVLKMQGRLDSFIKADASGLIQKAMDNYSLPVEKFNAIDDMMNKGRNRNHAAARDFNKNLQTRTLPADARELTKAVADAVRPVRHLSYFERQTAKALGKSVDSFGNLDLNANANRASGQSTNKNFRVANAGVEEMFATKTEFSGELGKAAMVKARSVCSQRCVPNGRSWCAYCGGEGWVQKTAREGNPSRSINKVREIQAKNRTTSKV